MNEFMEMLGLSGGSGLFTPEMALLNLLLAFIFGQVIAWVYTLSHTGLSYSRSFVQSIVLLTIIIAMGMMVIGNNIVIAFGLIGALAVIRFRNILKDTRDTAFIFATLIIGMATGTGHHIIGLVGVVVISITVMYLHWVSFGTRFIGDGFIRFQRDSEGAKPSIIQEVLARHCSASRLVTQRIDEEGGGDMAYRLLMRNPARASELVDELKSLNGISHVSFIQQEEQAEV